MGVHYDPSRRKYLVRRRDGHQPIITMQCGPTRHTIADQHGAGLALRLVRRDTDFEPSALPTEPSIQEIYSAIASDPRRIKLIADDVRELLDEGRTPLVPTERREHLDALEQRLEGSAATVVALHGDVTPRRRRQALARLAELPPGNPRVVLATGRLIGEAFDDPRLDTLLLTMPIAWKGTVVQYAGRLHRPHPASTKRASTTTSTRRYPFCGACSPSARSPTARCPT